MQCKFTYFNIAAFCTLSSSCRGLTVTVLGTAIAAITVNVGFTGSLLTRRFSSRVRCSSSSDFWFPKHGTGPLGERFISYISRKIFKWQNRNIAWIIVNNESTNDHSYQMLQISAPFSQHTKLDLGKMNVYLS